MQLSAGFYRVIQKKRATHKKTYDGRARKEGKMAEHTLSLTVDWPGGRNSVGSIEVGHLQTKVSIPKKMNGPEIGTNPSDMLLGAAGACYLITLAAMIERARLPLVEIGLESEGIVDITNGVITYKTIIHDPHVMLEADATKEDDEKLARLVHQADEHCMITRALKGNVETIVKWKE